MVNKKTGTKPLKWVPCWKIECSPALEVYSTYINFFGSHIEIDRLDGFIEQKEREYLFAKAAKEVWVEKFKPRNAKGPDDKL